MYGIKNCDAVKRARAWLKTRGVDYQFHDYKKLGCSTDQAKQFVKRLGVEAVINRRGTTWRKLDQSTRDNMDAESAVAAAQDNPSLIKRPILHSDNIIEAGFEEGRWKTLLG